MKNEELISKVKQADDNTDAQYEVVELQQRIEDLSSDKEKAPPRSKDRLPGTLCPI